MRKNRVSKHGLAALAGVLGGIGSMAIVASSAWAATSGAPAQAARVQGKQTLKVEVKTMTCAAINQALKTLPKEGPAMVSLVEGTYDCREPVVIDRSNTLLVGAGMNKTRLLAPPMDSFPVVVIGDMRVPAKPHTLELNNLDDDKLDSLEGHLRNAYSKYAAYDIAFKSQFYPLTIVEKVKLSGMSIVGGYYQVDKDGSLKMPSAGDAKAGDSSGASDIASAKECYDTMSREVSDCFDDGGRKIRNNALTVRRSRKVMINDVRVAHAFSGGIVFEKDCTEILVQDFQATKNAFDGFAGYQTDRSVFRRLLLNENNLSGISIDMDFNDNIFADSKIIDNGDNGIFAHHTQGNKYVNIEVARNGYLYKTNPNKSPGHGAWIDGKRKIVKHTCDDNVFQNVRFMDNAGTPLSIAANCQGITVEDVTIKTKDGNKADCQHNFSGSQVNYKGQFTCN